MTDDGQGMENKAEFEVMDGVEMVATGIAGGQVKLVVYYTGGDDRQALHADKYPKDFYADHTARGKIGNKVEDALDDYPLDAAAWVKAWEQWTSDRIAAGDEARPELVPANVRDLANGTQQVLVSKGGDTRRWLITIEWNDKTGEIVLDHNDMASGGATAVQSQLFKEFANSPEIEHEDWEALKSFWLEAQQETAHESMTETDRAVEAFTNTIKHRITPHDNPDALKSGKESAWVDDGNSYGLDLNGHADDVGSVVWVRSDLVSDVLDDMESAPAVGELGSELGQRVITARGSTNRKPAGENSARRYWFFTADALDITEMDVHTDEETDDDTPGAVDA